MAEAIFSGLIQSGAAAPEAVAVTDVSEARLQELRTRHGVTVYHNGPDGGGALQLLGVAETVFLAVKPQYFHQAVDPVGARFTPGHLVVSVMGGIVTADIERVIPGAPVVRVMPNTPMLVGCGAAGVCAGASATAQQAEAVRALFSAIGRAYVLPESLIDPLTGVSGCGPAFVYMMIEALADGGVADGLPRGLALELAAQTVCGAGKMVLETGKHPGVLKDEVCSPGGATIAGVSSLEQSGFRGAVIRAVGEAGRRMTEVGRVTG